MSLPLFLLTVSVLGLLGGGINAFLSDNGFPLPKTEETSDGQTIWRPGLLGNIIVGLATALVISMLNTDFDTILKKDASINLIMKSLAAALLAGVGGARILSSQVDKTLLRAAVKEGAASNAAPHEATNIDKASPANVLSITKNLPK